MKWNNLKNYECPTCKSKLEHQVDYDVYACTNCDFSIGKEKFNKIVNSKYNNAAYKEPDRSNWDW